MTQSLVLRLDKFDGIIKTIASLGPGETSFIPCNVNSLRAFLAGRLFNETKNTILAVLPTEEDSSKFAKDLEFFIGSENVTLFPSWEVLPFESQPPHPDVVASRLEALYNLSCDWKGIVVTTPASLIQRTIPRMILWEYIETLEVGKEIERDEFIGRLISIGYTRRAIVEERGELSVRGGVIDIFPPMYEKPVRIEFFGDEIERINLFDPATQRSGEALKGLTIIPASELIISDESKDPAIKRLKERADELNMTRGAREVIAERIRGNVLIAGMGFLMPLFYDQLETVFDYLPEDTRFIYDRESLIMEEFNRLRGEIVEMAERSVEKEAFFVTPSDMYLPVKEIVATFAEKGGLYLGMSADTFDHHQHTTIDLAYESNIDIRQAISIVKKESPLLPLVERIRDWLDIGWNIYLVPSSAGNAHRLKELLANYDLQLDEVARMGIIESSAVPVNLKSGKSPKMIVGTLSAGFRLDWLRMVIITEEEIFGEKGKRKKPSSRKVDAFLSQLDDLVAGNFIVHMDHGIGIYKGLTRFNVGDIENDFLILEYSGGDKLYLPVDRLNLLSKYRGAEGKTPPLNRLGAAVWTKTKKKVKESVEKVARELLTLYAAREVVEGYAFPSPDATFAEFEAAFEHDETPDQLKAIEDVIDDMQRPRPMDRLICGDVGYGKTEVAMRAALLAVLDGKQVAILVPTTVLAQQHEITFNKRFANYPVNIDSVSRFKGQKEQKEILEKLEKGKLDIIIGTHRLLQRDVNFKDLGLVIIDEEHRFGVKHKERLKQLRKNVDVLTLSATPIPRTLHMSFAGIRDMSIIVTPPEDRQAIKTVIAKSDETVIRDAVLRELSRGGQVFFVHNRVQGIETLAERLRSIVPEARIAVAHGQMRAKELERIMSAFIKKEYDLLLSTSIIESGLDIPAANTIIIDRTDRFGLAEIYQLRGRVGRSKHRAYAYLLTPPNVILSSDARKRLEVLQELSELGAGFKLAIYYLEIRGAGELLGHSQSGQIAEVGFDLYTRLLNETVRELQGKGVKDEVEPEVNMRIPTFIPDDYIPDPGQRLTFYKRIASVASEEELSDIEAELIDRFGKIPQSVSNLLNIIILKLMLKVIGAVELLQRAERLYIRFNKDTTFDLNTLLSMVKKQPDRYILKPDSRLIFVLEKGEEPLDATKSMLQKILSGKQSIVDT